MLIATDRPVPENSKVWFLDYIKDAFLNTLSTLLQFITAFKQLPVWRLDKKAVLKFLPDTDKKNIPRSDRMSSYNPTSNCSFIEICILRRHKQVIRTWVECFCSPSYTLWT